MMADAPAPTECHSLQFKQLCKLKTLHDSSKTIYKKPTCLVATASNYGLLIIGEKCGFKVIPLNEIFVKDLPNYNPKNELHKYMHRNFILPSPPSHVEVNCNHELLGVIFERDETPVLRIYKTESFFHKDVIVFNEVRLTSVCGTHVTDFSWNPNVPNVVTCCISDGSLSVITFIANGNYEVKSLPKESNSTCFCWSPKGKQIVVGDGMGRLTQYVPDLRSVKSCSPPAVIFDKPCTIRGVKWLSNFQFIGVYTLQDSYSQNGDKRTSIVVINTPKNSPVTYINYEDVCFSSGTERPCQFYFIHVTAWNLLFVASANAVEVAVMSLNPNENVWSLRILDDPARITLPMCKSDETYPVGISVDYCSRIRSSVGDKVVAMPMLSLLTSEGIVCLYLINFLESSAPPICTETNFKSSLEYFTHETVLSEKHEEKSAFQVQSETKNLNSISQPSLSTPVLCEPNADATHPASYFRETNAAVANNSQLPFNNANMFIQSNLDTNNDTNTASIMTATNPIIETSVRNTENLTEQKSTSDRIVSDNTTKKTIELKSGNDALKKFKKAASAFQNDIREVRYLVECINVNDSGRKENSENFGKLKEKVTQLKTSIASLLGETDVIKTSIIETFACIQEIKSKQFKLTHPGYQTLSSLREIEPTHLMSLKNVENNINYLRSQTEKATEQLDEIWLKYSEYNQTSNRFALPVFDNIYATIVQQRKIFELLSLQTEKFQKQLACLKGRMPCKLSTFNDNDSSDSMDSSLADLAKNALNLNNGTDFQTDLKMLANKYAIDHAKRFHLSYSKQIKLQDLLSSNRVTYIQSSRLQRLKKKSLIILSKSSFVNDVNEEEMKRLPVPPVKEELNVKLINSINGIEEYNSNNKMHNTDKLSNSNVTHSASIKSNSTASSVIDTSNLSRLPPTTELKSNGFMSERASTTSFTSKQNVIGDKEQIMTHTTTCVRDSNELTFASSIPATTGSSETHFPLVSNSLPTSRSLFNGEKVDTDKSKSIFSLPSASTLTSSSFFSSPSLVAPNSASISASYSTGSIFSTNVAQSVFATKENDMLPFASATSSVSFPSSATSISGSVSTSAGVLTAAPASVFSGKLSTLSSGNFILNSNANTELFGSLLKSPASSVTVPSFGALTSTLSTVANETIPIPKPNITSPTIINNVAKPTTTISNSGDIKSSQVATSINFGSALTAGLDAKIASTSTVTKNDQLNSFNFSSKISDSVTISKVPVVIPPDDAESNKTGTVSDSKSDVSFSFVLPISSQSNSIEKPADTVTTVPATTTNVCSFVPQSLNTAPVSLNSVSSIGSSPSFFSAMNLSASPSSSIAAPLMGVSSTTCTVSPFSSVTTIAPITTPAITTTITSKSTDGPTFGNVGSFFSELNITSPTTGSSSSFFRKPITSVPAVTTSGQSTIFGQSTTTSLFGQALNVAAEENKPVFGSAVTSFASNPQPSIFGGNSLFGSASVFGNTSTSVAQPNTHLPGTRNSIFGGGNVGFNTVSSNSAFQSVSSSFSAPTSFTGSTAQTENPASGFGSPPSFSSVFNKTAPSFPAFGGAPTFGGSPAFGNSPTKVFGQPISNLGTFGSSISQQPTSFENFANENTISFGNLAQQPGAFSSTQSFGHANTSPSFGSSNFGGNSFSSWRQ